MIKYEVKDEQSKLDFLKEQSKFFSAKMFKSKDLKWLEGNKFTEAQIQEIYPDYKKVAPKSLYYNELKETKKKVKKILNKDNANNRSPIVDQQNSKGYGADKGSIKIDAKTK